MISHSLNFRPNFENLLGKRFGRLVCVSYIGRFKSGNDTNHFRHKWLFKCDCGNLFENFTKNIKRAKNVSCGCWMSEIVSEKSKKHGMYKSPEYSVWSSLIDRTKNPKSKDYKSYGAIGIGVCDEWLTFKKFYEDMGPRPSIKHSIDRIDNTKGYCKENCRWADQRTQCRNKSNNVRITAFDRTMLLIEWAEELGIPYETLARRIFTYKWPIETALSKPVRKYTRRGEI